MIALAIVLSSLAFAGALWAGFSLWEAVLVPFTVAGVAVLSWGLAVLVLSL